MPIRVAKDFRFEAAHRLPWHEGACASLHGHSYHLTISLVGEPDSRGMVVDFGRIKKLVSPLIDEWDHSVLVAEYDTDLRDAVSSLGSRFVVLPVDTTAENLASLVADFISDEGAQFLDDRAIQSIGVTVRETTTSEAHLERAIGR